MTDYEYMAIGGPDDGERIPFSEGSDYRLCMVAGFPLLVHSSVESTDIMLKLIEGYWPEEGCDDGETIITGIMACEFCQTFPGSKMNERVHWRN